MLITNRAKHSLLIASLILIHGCGSSDYTIDYPADNQAFDDRVPDNYIVNYLTSPPEKITLNGADVSSHFTFSNGIGTASGESFLAFIKQGENLFSVDAANFGPSVNFYVDTEGPSVVVNDVSGTSNKSIKGFLVDPKGSSSLIVNGVVATLDTEGNFEVQVPQGPVYHFEATDRDGRTSLTRYASREEIIQNSAELRIDQNGINGVLAVAQEVLEAIDFNQLLSAPNASTLFNEKLRVTIPGVTIIPEVCFDPCGGVFGGCKICTPAVEFPSTNVNIASIKGTLTNFSLDEVQVDRLDIASGVDLVGSVIDPPSGIWEGFVLEGKVRDLTAGVEIQVDLLGLSSIAEDALHILGLADELSFLSGKFEAELTASSVRALADIALSVDNGEIDFSIPDIHNVDIVGARVETNVPTAFSAFLNSDNVASDVIQGGIIDSLEFIVDNFLGSLLPKVIDPLIDEFLDRIQLYVKAQLSNGAQLSTLFAIQSFDVASDNSSISVGMGARLGAERNSEAPEVGLDVGYPSIDIEAPILFKSLDDIPALGAAPGIVPEALGFLSLEGVVPTPVNTSGYQLGLGVSSNIVNQALLMFYESGLLSVAIGVLPDGSTILDRNAGGSVSARILVAPGAAPELTFKGTDTVVTHLTLNDYGMHLQERDESGEWVETAAINVSLKIPVIVNIVDSQLSISLLSPDFDAIVSVSADDVLDLYASSVFSSVYGAAIVDVINQGLTAVKLPVVGSIVIGDAALEIKDAALSVVGEGKKYIEINANFR